MQATSRQTDLFASAAEGFDPSSTLALLSEVISSKKRSLSFLVDRNSDFASHWGIPIRRHFYNALDIAEASVVVGTELDGELLPPRSRLDKEQRKRAKTITRLAMTQGSNFAFASRDVICDHELSHSETWEESCRHIGHRIVIVSASPAGERLAGRVEYVVEKKISGINFEKIHQASCTQHDFVRRLIVGIEEVLSEGSPLRRKNIG